MKLRSIYIIYLLGFKISTSLAIGPCQSCYIQRAAYSVQCMVSPHLNKWYGRWCSKVYAQAEILSDYANLCDASLNLTPSTGNSIVKDNDLKTIDPCRQCISLVTLTSTACIDGNIKPKSRCGKAKKCVKMLWTTFRRWPYTIK